MGEDQRDVGAQVTGADDPEAIRAKIEDTREELGDTVAALSYKTDVKARTRDKVEDARATVTEKVENARATAGAKANELATKAQDAMPAAAQERVADASRRMRRQPGRAIAVVGAVLGTLLLIVRRRRRG